MPTTIHDVASAAGVSVTTVSHVLNNKGRVDPETQQRVRQIARQLGYRANRYARGLRSGQSGTLALLLPVGSDPRTDEALSLDFYMRLASAAAATAFSREHALILLPPAIGPEGLRGFMIDGGIAVDPLPGDPWIELLSKNGVPIVTIERDLGRPEDRCYVATQTDANTRQLLDHLAERGARRIALLQPDRDWSWAKEALDTYHAWTREHAAESLVVEVPTAPGEQSAFEATCRLLRSDSPPDAVIAVASRFLRGVLRGAQATGRTVPDDLLVATGVDTVQAREGHPSVTALDLHPELQAEAAIEMLLARIAGTEPQEPRYVPATLQVRASTMGPSRGPGAEAKW